ncbi:MAG: MIP/aquaporin family protein [Chloroflexota bacterium]
MTSTAPSLTSATPRHFHWPEYLIEAGGLGLFMLSACTFAVLLDLSDSWGQRTFPDPTVRRLIFGLAMGLTAVGIIYSPWGQRSGAHLNPATTLTFLRLGKAPARDAVGYMAAQFIGGIAGVGIAAVLLSPGIADPTVHYVVTRPGEAGPVLAFIAELFISFGLMMAVLIVSNSARHARFTGICAGVLVATYITLEAPLSGMSMNPARTIGSAVLAQDWTAIWVYLTAPVLGMLLAAEVYLRVRGPASVRCAKLQHPRTGPCIFHCSIPGQH